MKKVIPSKRAVLLALGLCAAAVCLVLLILWLRPRSMEALVGAPPESLTFWGIESNTGETDDMAITSLASDGNISGEGALEYLYGLTFSRPGLSPVLSCENGCGRYSLAFTWEGRAAKRFDLLEDGTLWDGTWRYSLAGGETAAAELRDWLDAAFG